MRRRYSRADATLTSPSHLMSQNFSSLLNFGQHVGLEWSGELRGLSDVTSQTAKQQSGREPPAGGSTRPAISGLLQPEENANTETAREFSADPNPTANRLPR